ncbi:hypothetical protein BDE02_05G145000 [Populus trichocarpa]|nr:hypothetical protein BDE02_05G145000 [Populus trichocarpa]
MQSQCSWTPCKMPTPLSFKPLTFSTFSFSKQLLLHKKSIASISSTSRGIVSYPSLMASSPSVSTTQKDAFSTQNDSTRKTQQPLQVAKRLEKFKTTIFTQMSSLAIKYGAINLGQGFPNFDGPEFVKEAAIKWDLLCRC